MVRLGWKEKRAGRLPDLNFDKNRVRKIYFNNSMSIKPEDAGAELRKSKNCLVKICWSSM